MGMAGRQGVIGMVACIMLILLGGLLPAAALATTVTARHGPASMVFEPNQGQAEEPVKFLARGRGYGLFLTPTEAVLVLAPSARGAARDAAASLAEPLVVRMRLLGADAGATIAGDESLPGRSNYLLGQADRWQHAVPAFARVRYTDVYPGISLVFYGTDRQLEYDFIVAPGADPAAVALAFDGVEGLHVDGAGDLVLATGAGDLRLRRPVIYQEVDGERRPVDGGYVVDGNRVRFRMTAWDPARPLVIDPILAYSTFLGGSSNDQGFGITVDATGNAYVTGSTISSNFPVSSSPLQATRRGVTDAFVTKLDPTGALVFSTFLGGSGDDAGNAIVVDGSGNVLVAGTTTSGNFPVQGASPFAPFQSTLRGGNDAFVAKLDPTGGTLVYSTYLGSNTDDFGTGIAVDALGNAYVTGIDAVGQLPEQQCRHLPGDQEHRRRCLRRQARSLGGDGRRAGDAHGLLPVPRRPRRRLRRGDRGRRELATSGSSAPRRRPTSASRAPRRGAPFRRLSVGRRTASSASSIRPAHCCT